MMNAIRKLRSEMIFMSLNNLFVIYPFITDASEILISQFYSKIQNLLGVVLSHAMLKYMLFRPIEFFTT